MLNLILGKDRVALSEFVMSKVCESASSERTNQILIVPEQFSHEAERRLCEIGGDTISRYAEVLSLSRLSDRVAASCGGIARAYLDKGGQLLSMAMAAEQVASRIKLFAAVLRKPEFLADLVKMVGEFRSYRLEPHVLLATSRKMEGHFAQKLEELGLLYEAYLAVCANGKADPSDKLVRLCDGLQETEWASSYSFYVDGFSDFTGAELAVLELLLQRGNTLTVTLLTGTDESAVSGVTKQTVHALKHMADRWYIPCHVQTLVQQVKRAQAVQAFLDGVFFSVPCAAEPGSQILLRRFDSVEEECCAAVLHIKRLLMKGNRCRDISVAYTDPALYLAPLRAALERAELPVYYAGETDVLDQPVVSAVLHALFAATGQMDYEDVALYLKSGLPLLDQDRCDRLDQYAFRWNLHGKQWDQTWSLHPRGFGELWTDEDRQQLGELEQDRDTAMGPLLLLRRKLQSAGNTGEMVQALFVFLEELRLGERLEQQAAVFDRQGQGQAAQILQQVYEMLQQSMEQMWLIIGETSRSPEDFAKLYKLLLTQYRIGTIPAGLDQIHVSDLPDLRNRKTGHLLLLGAEDGLFPAYKTAEGLLTEAERRQLAQQGITIAPSRADQMDQELGRIQSACMAAEKMIWMSYSGDQPAWLYRRACSLFPDAAAQQERLSFLDLPALAAWRVRTGQEDPLGIASLDQLECSLKSLRAYSFAPLSKSTVQGLYGRQIYLSASRIDKYAACRFAFFLAYGLKAQPRRQAAMDPSVFGTFVHAVLEQVVRRVMDQGGFREVTEEQLLSAATEEINQYASLHFPEQAERAAYLFRRSQAEILDIVMDLGEELKNSLFQPVSCELEFSSQGQLPPIEIQGTHASCQISGFVDRVDLYQDGQNAFVRVVDYKTGKKDFDYTDILNGAGLQMLVYLFALRQYGGALFEQEKLEPAGVLYLPARKEYMLTDPLPDEEMVQNGHRQERKRKGLIRSDPELLAAMEADPESPRYMPYEVGKHGVKGDLADQRQMVLLERHVIRTLANMTDSIATGDVKPNPVVRGQYGSCRYCDYATVCHRDLCGGDVRNLAVTSAAKFWEKLEQEERDG